MPALSRAGQQDNLPGTDAYVATQYI
jgi:hypothetical protein